MKKTEIKQGINLYFINDKKFKSFRACAIFHRPLCKEEVTKNTLLTAVMRQQCENYPDAKAISEALENLYGADLIARATKYGEEHLIKLGIQSVADAVVGKTNFDNAMALLSDIVLKSGSGTGFSADIVATEKENIRDAILSQKNDKRSYSVLRLQEEMCKDEPYGINPLGCIDELSKIGCNELYEHYQKVLNESRVDIIFTGNFDEDAAKAAAEKIAQSLTGRNPQNIETKAVRTVKEVKTVTDKMDVTQGKLCMGFRCTKEISKKDYPAAMVYNTVFGGSATSKLFENVREKLSLCYYVTSSIDRLKQIMVVRSGVEFESFKKAYDEIMLQQSKMVNGEITPEEIETAKKQLVNAYQSNYDSIRALEEYYTMQLLLGTDISIEDMKKAVEAVTLEEITEIAKSMLLDTVYYIDKEA